MVSTKAKKGMVFGIGSFLVLLGGILGGCWNYIFDLILENELVLTDSSKSFDLWKEIPIPMYMDFYLYNWTNVEEVIQADFAIKPEFKEIGPFVFSEHHTRVNLVWNSNGTVTYQQVRRWNFEPDLSGENLTLDYNITNINVIATTTAYMVRHLPKLMRLFVGLFMKKAGAEFYITKTAGELLFDGYNDTLLDMANQLNSSLFNIPFKTFGYFVDRNESATYDGVFNMFTGETGLNNLGMLQMWNYNHLTPYYGYPCNVVKGSSGELWAPIKDYSNANIFAPDICATVSLQYVNQAEVHGVEGLAYTGTAQTFDNGSLFPEQRCFCVGECLPSGTLNASLCRFNAPLHISYPHFYLADPYYLELVDGLIPNKALHEFQFALEPVTGIPMYANARLQLNLMIEKYPDIPLFEKVADRLFIPTLWFNQRVELSESLADEVKLILKVPAIGMGVLFGVAGIGALLLFIGAMLTIRHGWKGSDGEQLLFNGQ